MKHLLFVAILVLLAIIALQQHQANDLARYDHCNVPAQPGEQYDTWLC